MRSLVPTPPERLLVALAVLLAVLGGLGLAGCGEQPTESSFQSAEPQASPVEPLNAKPDCSVNPSHPSCGGDDGDGGDDGGTSDQVNLAMTLDDTQPAITSDGLGAYVEGVDGVEAHFSSANGNLMIQTEAGPRLVRIAVPGAAYDNLIPVHRNYTRENINFTDGTTGTDVDLRTIDPGDDVSAAVYVEWNDPDGTYFELRYGALCTEDKFDGDPTNDSHRVQVERTDADTWIISSPPIGDDATRAGAVLCKGEKVGQSGKVTMTEVAALSSADAAFSMTLVRQP